MKISVIITTYGRPDKLENAIKSVLNQTYKNIEVVVVDDNNPDSLGRKETEEKLRKFQEQIVYIKHDKNYGANKARNTGINVSKGKYISLLDDDDEFYPDKIEKIVRELKKEKYDLIYTGADFVEEETGAVKYVFNKNRDPKKQILCNNYIMSNSFVVLKKSKILEVGGFDESLKSCQDWDLWIRIIYNEGRVKGIAESLVKYTVSSNMNRITNNYLKVKEGHKKILEKYQFYLSDLDDQNKNEILAEQYKLLAYIEYNFSKLKNYRKILNKSMEIKKEVLTKNDWIKYFCSYLGIKITKVNNKAKILKAKKL